MLEEVVFQTRLNRWGWQVLPTKQSTQAISLAQYVHMFASFALTLSFSPQRSYRNNVFERRSIE
jgi:hypothetical protein